MLVFCILVVISFCGCLSEEPTDNIPPKVYDEPLDFLTAIDLPEDDSSDIVYVSGLDGYPAFYFTQKANIFKPLVLQKLPRDFALQATVKTSNKNGGFLFAILNPFHDVVQLGLHLTKNPENEEESLISLFYNDYRAPSNTSLPLVRFAVPNIVKHWTPFAIKVNGSDITLYLHCEEYETQHVVRSPEQLLFEDGSTVYLGQAGFGEKFEGAIQELKFSNDLKEAENHCGEGWNSGDYDLDIPVSDADKFSGEKWNHEVTISPPPISPPPPPRLIKGPKGNKGNKGEHGQAIYGLPGPPGKDGLPGAKGDTGRKGDMWVPPHPDEIKGERGPPGEPGQSFTLPLDPNHQFYDIVRERLADVYPDPVPGPRGYPGIPGVKGDKGDLGPPGIFQFDEETGSGEQVVYSPEGSGGSGEDLLPSLVEPKGGQQDIPGVFVGEPGRDGLPGPPGLPGLPIKSFKGDKGEMGSVGFPGPIGPRGPAGIDGVAGLKGEMGQKGDKGDVGHSIKGDQGPEGPKGRRGRRGKPGLLGPVGPPGEIGLPGFPGRSGARGLQGPVGRPGFGLKGNKGDQGPPGTVYVQEGSDVTVKLIKGDKGESGRPGVGGRPGLRGPMGPKGSQGMPGMPGMGSSLPYPGPRGFKGSKGDRGQDGRPGISVPGKQGAQGPPGPPGRPGPVGPPAYIGADNTIRDPIKCPPGPPGPAGPPGTPGKSASSKHLQGGLSSAVIFLTEDNLMNSADLLPVGSVIFILQSEKLFLRVQVGFKEILLGSEILLLPKPTPESAANLADIPVMPTPLPRVDIPIHDNGVVTGSKLHIVAANAPYTGYMGGLSGADYTCFRESRRAGLSGTYRAFLASRVQNLRSIVHRKNDRSIPVVNAKDELLANSWSDLVDGNGGQISKDVAIYSFDGKNVMKDPLWPQKKAWIGSNHRGERKLGSFCGGWDTSSSAHKGVASSLIDRRLLKGEEFSCRSSFVLLCVEITHQHRLR